MTHDATPFDCFYRLDAWDRLVEWGGPQWASFADDDGGAEPAAGNLGGDSIYDHVAGHFTKRFLKAFFAEARAADAPLSRTYRCDSPRAKRLMQMRAICEGDGGLRIEHRLVEESQLPAQAARDQAADARRAPYLRCSICNRLKPRGAQAWREPEAYAVPAQPLEVVHTVCPECRRGVRARLPFRPTALA